ncbi:MAG: MBL fold metallo-hydrolase [Bacteroidetes bacterium HGW-Bacteroidetes-12]|nr:MAG: MBL fold metallo-hydrolase [Bacteroidetes bacterium HGW-Bacteroidetes-12]
MNLHIIKAETWKIDGGVCFGVVPKSIWGKASISDENNLITICNRLLLVETNDRKVLIDTGFGNKQSEKYYSFKYIQTNHSLEDALNKVGFDIEEITDVIFTHLHDDHCGGASFFNKENKEVEFVFKNANYWISKSQWNSAMNPNKREMVAFLKENFLILEKINKLNLITEEKEIIPNISIRIFNGHTTGQIIPIINYQGRKIVYIADFIPSISHIPLPYIASVDVRPLLTLKEKEDFLKEAVEKNYTLFFEHDAKNECCKLKNTTKGIRVSKTFKLDKWIKEKQ